MGAPNATETPAAAAADSTCRRNTEFTVWLQNRVLQNPSAAAHLSPLALVLAVLGEEAAEEVAAATGHVDQRTLLPQTEARRHGQNQGHGLYQQGPFPQVAPDDEAAQDGLDLMMRKFYT